MTALQWILLLWLAPSVLMFFVAVICYVVDTLRQPRLKLEPETNTIALGDAQTVRFERYTSYEVSHLGELRRAGLTIEGVNNEG